MKIPVIQGCALIPSNQLDFASSLFSVMGGECSSNAFHFNWLSISFHKSRSINRANPLLKVFFDYATIDFDGHRYLQRPRLNDAH